MMITCSDLRAWRVGPVLYRWFLRSFPDGGSYADVHRALEREGFGDWADSLVEYGWSKWLNEARFVQQDIFAMARLASPQTADDNGRQLASATDSDSLGSAGDNVKIASAGYAAQIASAGYSARIGSVGYNTHVGSSGNRSRIAVAGNSTRISSVGNSTRIASTGMRVRISSLGERSRIASSGDLTQIASFGPESKIANCADNVHIIASGENAVVASTGEVDSIILGPGGCAALAYHDGERMRFAVAIEGENNIRAGVKYRLNDDHQFVAC